MHSFKNAFILTTNRILTSLSLKRIKTMKMLRSNAQRNVFAEDIRASLTKLCNFLIHPVTNMRWLKHNKSCTLYYV